MHHSTINSRPEAIWEVMGDVRVAGRFHADVADLVARRLAPTRDPRPRRAGARIDLALGERLGRLIELAGCYGRHLRRRPASAGC